MAYFTSRSVLRKFNPFRANADLVEPLTLLIDHIYVRPSSEKGGGYEVNPAALSGQTNLACLPEMPILRPDYAPTAPPRLVTETKATVQTAEVENCPLGDEETFWTTVT